MSIYDDDYPLQIIEGRLYFLMYCYNCNKKMPVRDDYFKRKSGYCVSCGKMGNKQARKHGDYKERIYKIWQGIKNRCYNKNNAAYNHYGGKGIGMCKEWISSYKAFREWSYSNGYKDNLTIDRIDNSKSYSPNNCQWITREENARKDKAILSSAQKIDFYMERKRLGMKQRDFAKIKNVSRNTIQRAEKYAKEALNEHL